MKKHKHKKLIIKIFAVLVFLSLNLTTFAIKTTLNNKLTNIHLKYNIPNDENIIMYSQKKNFIIITTVSKNGIIIKRKIQKSKLSQEKKEEPSIYGPYKNDPDDESDEEWEINNYVSDPEKNPGILITAKNIECLNYFKIKIISNDPELNKNQNKNNRNIPGKYIYYAGALTLNYQKADVILEYSKYTISTNLLMNYLKKIKNNIDKNIDINMFIIDNRIKLSKPLNFPKSQWTKRQKNLNYIIYVKREFIQNLTPDEWQEIIFYTPLQVLA